MNDLDFLTGSEEREVVGISEVGRVGLKRYSGYVYDEFLVELQGRRGIETFKEMSGNDAVVGAVLFAIQMLIRQVDWHAEAYSSDPADIAAAEFLDSCFNDMSQSWADTLIEILSMLPYGWSYHEIVYKVRGGPESKDTRFKSAHGDWKYGWRKLPIRGQDSLQRWIYLGDDFDQLLGMRQLPAPSFIPRDIPIEKSLLFRPSSHKNNPEGRSILRNAYLDWYFKKNIQRIEAIGIERDLAGLPVLRVPDVLFSPSATADQKSILEDYKRIATNLRRDEQEGLVMPSSFDQNGNRQYDVSLLTTGGTRQFNTDPVLQRYDRRIAMTVMADWLFIGHQATGSFALIDNKTDIFVTAIGSFLDSIAEIFNRYAIPRLWEMNGWPLDRLPKWVPGDIESPDLAKLGPYISQLAGAGINLLDKTTEDFLKRAAGLPVEEQVREGDLEDTGTEGGQTTTDGEPPHNHTFTVDQSGNGLTQATSDGPGHQHTIIDGVIRPAQDGHSHTPA